MTTQITESWIPSTDSFGARLALVRWRMGWNLKEAALACNLPASSWRQWELHGNQPRNFADVALAISERTGVDDYWIMTGRNSGGHPDGPNARPSDYKAGVVDLFPGAARMALMASA